MRAARHRQPPPIPLTNRPGARLSCKGDKNDEKPDWPDHNVTLTMLQQRIRVTYEIDGKQLLLTANGQQMVFDIIAGNCLDGGGLFGKFCKS